MVLIILKTEKTGYGYVPNDPAFGSLKMDEQINGEVGR